MNKKFYLTTPIFYPNDRLHLGHAYTMIIADIIARYKKSKGYHIYFQTGSDDHGEKIEKKAAFLNISPQKLVDNNVLLFQQLWEKLGVSEHTFYRTSSPKHLEKVQKTFAELEKKGDIYLGEYHGKYCIICEDYVSQSKAFNHNFCPTCQAELRTIDEPAYFLKVSQYYSHLVEHYQKSPDFLWPSKVKKELFSNFLKEDVPDLCITRSDITWGVPVPDQKGMVIYVWFEALLNYLNSDQGEEIFNDHSAEIVQLIGKEIVRFHAIYWPTILFTLHKRLPTKILAHGWLITPTGKMSKSKGNVIDPFKLLKKYPSDLLRIYFVAKINFLRDGICSEELLREFYQEFFINSLGNLCSRTWKMLRLYNNDVIPSFEKSQNAFLIKYYEEYLVSIKRFEKQMDDYQLTLAFQEVKKILDLSNKLIQDLEPWNLFKEKNRILLNQFLNYLVNGIKIVAFLLNSIIPETSGKILEILSVDSENLNWNNCSNFAFLNEIKLKSPEKHLYESLK